LPKRPCHELRELREKNRANETARNSPDAKTATKENDVSLLFSRNLLFLCRLPVLQLLFSCNSRNSWQSLFCFADYDAIALGNAEQPLDFCAPRCDDVWFA
jgi:hypothetical protein